MKYIQLILAFLGTIFLIGLPYMLAFWGYNFLASTFDFFPELTFVQFLLVVLAIELIRNLFKRSKSEK